MQDKDGFGSGNLEFNFPGDDMDNFRAAQEAGWKVIGGEQLTVSTSAVRLFPNPPANTRMCVFTVRTTPITVSALSGTNPTAGAVGNDYAAGGPYALPLNDSEAAGVKAIRNGGADAAIYAEYWSLP